MKIRSMNLRLLTISACFSAALSLFVADTARAEDRFLALGGAALIGDTVCKLINDKRDIHLVRCLSYPTGGSVYNIQGLTSGELDIAITRADLAYKAFNGLAQFASIGPNRKLRTVTNLYNRPLSSRCARIPGSTVSMISRARWSISATAGRASATIADQMFRDHGLDERRTSPDATEFSTRGQAKPFCEEKVDILIEAIGLPAPLYDRLARRTAVPSLSTCRKELADAAFRKVRAVFLRLRDSGQHQSEQRYRCEDRWYQGGPA